MSEVLQHYGIPGMKWGIRRFQNVDGSLTSAGRKRYDDDNSAVERRKSVAKKAAIGTVAVAGVVLTAYLVKKHGVKKVTELSAKTEQGKIVMDKLQSTTSVLSTPVSHIQDYKPEPGKTIRQTIKTAVETTGSAVKSPPTYDFEALMKQNDELLKKMYTDLLS